MNINEVSAKFSTPEKCIRFIESKRWAFGRRCCYCDSKRTAPVRNTYRYHCHACNRNFSVFVGTIFEDTKLPLLKWFQAISLMINGRKGISSRQLARDIGVDKKTAWYLQLRIRSAMSEYGSNPDSIYFLRKPKKIDNSKLRNSGRLGRSWLREKSLPISRQENKERVQRLLGRKNQSTTNESDCRLLPAIQILIRRAVFGQYHHVQECYFSWYLDECYYKYVNKYRPDLFDHLILRSLEADSA